MELKGDLVFSRRDPVNLLFINGVDDGLTLVRVVSCQVKKRIFPVNSIIQSLVVPSATWSY